MVPLLTQGQYLQMPHSLLTHIQGTLRSNPELPSAAGGAAPKQLLLYQSRHQEAVGSLLVSSLLLWP